MATIEIDGKTVEVEPGQMLIEAAEAAEVTIPRFCYHKKLSIAANCRMCLVEVENAPKVMPACATPISDGMVVKTKSPKALAAQRAVMEFLLINHPLDCPICDQGGQCELQDVAMGYGSDLSVFSEGKRSVVDQDIGPLIETEMTRCIHCTRCVRFGDEVAGLRELGATGRGEHVQIGTFLAESVGSNLSGNVIDLCPVGALTSKPFRYQARAWEMTAHDSIAAHDCLGSNTQAHVLRNKVMRVVPRENETVNEVWLSDRDRFSYESYNSPDRALSPQIKVNGQWESVCWEKALAYAVQSLQKIGTTPDSLGFLAGPSTTLEEGYLFQALARGLGTNNIDHRLTQSDTRGDMMQGLMPSLGTPLSQLENADCIVIVGSNLTQEVPLLALRVRKAIQAGAQVFVINETDDWEMFEGAKRRQTTPQSMVSDLQALLSAVNGKTDDALAKAVQSSNDTHFIVGNRVRQHPSFATIRQLVQQIAEKTESTFGQLTPGANSAGLHLAGCIPHREVGGAACAAAGMSAHEMFQSPRDAYCLMGFDPELDTLDPFAALKALEQARCVVSITPFVTPMLRQYADVILPMALPMETAGCYINVLGQWQSFLPAVTPPEEAKPGWKILRVLANLSDLPGFDYLNVLEVRTALRSAVEKKQCEVQPQSSLPELSLAEGIIRIPQLPCYTVDSTVRHATALSQTPLMQQDRFVRISTDIAKKLGLKCGQKVCVQQDKANEGVIMKCKVETTLPEACIQVPQGVPEGVVLHGPYQPVEIRPA